MNDRNRFALALRTYLETSRLRAVDLERAAALPNATITKLTGGNRPSVERVAEILAAMPPAEAAQLLIAYLEDDIPEAWRAAVQILVTTGDSTLHELPAERRDHISRVLDAIQRRARADLEFAQWLTETAQLLQLVAEE